MNITKLIEKAEELIFDGNADLCEEAEKFIEVLEINGKKFKLTVNLKILDKDSVLFYEGL